MPKAGSNIRKGIKSQIIPDVRAANCNYTSLIHSGVLMCKNLLSHHNLSLYLQTGWNNYRITVIVGWWSGQKQIRVEESAEHTNDNNMKLVLLNSFCSKYSARMRTRPSFFIPQPGRGRPTFQMWQSSRRKFLSQAISLEHLLLL